MVCFPCGPVMIVVTVNLLIAHARTSLPSLSTPIAVYCEEEEEDRYNMFGSIALRLFS